MKIPLSVRKQFNEVMAFANVIIRAPLIRRPASTELVVDTGSPWISIAPRDVKRLNIPISALRRPKKFSTILFAGSKFWRYLLENATVYMRDEAGETVKVQLPTVSVLWPTKGEPEEFDSIPVSWDAIS